ncbi:hypothetical protein HY489_02505 [Candidatus Woesearchaeota archaeon]|nr:hypothetical protein [Candidatus Woesearchaeota archaeon]
MIKTVIAVLKGIGLTDNEITIYLALLQGGLSTAYDLGKKTGIYRVHVYDKLEQLTTKGLVTSVYMGAKKHFQATSPEKIIQYLEDKRKHLDIQETEVVQLLPELRSLMQTPKEDTKVEVFKGIEGMKYFLRDVIKMRKEVLVTGINDIKYKEYLGVAMLQYFRDCKKYGIKERVITVDKPDVFRFPVDVASKTEYRFLAEKQFNPTNTFVYGDKVVIVTWGVPVTAIMIQNKNIAETYRSNFEYLWNIAKTTPTQAQ